MVWVQDEFGNWYDDGEPEEEEFPEESLPELPELDMGLPEEPGPTPYDYPTYLSESIEEQRQENLFNRGQTERAETRAQRAE